MFHLKKLVVLLGIISATPAAFANPVLDEHPNLAPTGATVDQTTPGKTVVNQTDSHAIIHWKSFNIAGNETTHFEQPQGGIALNRIDPNQGVSEIYGHLTATGKVVLINQQGIYFGPGSQVNVGSLIASARDMTDENFLNNKFIFDQPSQYSGSIINRGNIEVDEAGHGLVALLGPGVVNEGKIQANYNHIVLASGNKFTLDFDGDQLINFTVDEGITQAGVDEQGQALKDGVKNTGTLQADGGSIYVTANAASDVVDNVINMNGVAQAQTVSTNQRGEIILNGGNEGTVNIGGKLDVSGGGRLDVKGGDFKATGNIVKTATGTVITASGDAGGGNILLGGDKHGKPITAFGRNLKNATRTIIGSNTTLEANAGRTGNGGNIVVWSDYLTWAMNKQFAIRAHGGSEYGKGGFAEVSSSPEKNGHLYANLANIVPYSDLSSVEAKGNTKLLLDPRNVTISNTPPTVGGTFSLADPSIFTPTSDDSNVYVGDITFRLNNPISVIITTGGTGTQAGNITVATPINWSSNEFLELNAANNIIINGQITAPAGTLRLSAANHPGSISAPAFGNNFSQAIHVANLVILQGQLAGGLTPAMVNALITAIAAQPADVPGVSYGVDTVFVDLDQFASSISEMVFDQMNAQRYSVNC